MRETPLYQGTRYQEAKRPQAQLPTLSLPDNPFSRVLPQVIAQVEREVDRYSDLKDYQLGMEKTLAMKRNEAEFRQELRRRMELPWGSQDSVYLVDGKMNQEAISSLVSQHAERNMSLRGGFLKAQNEVKYDGAVESANTFLELDALELLSAQERQNMMQVANDTFDLMDESGDIHGAYAVVDSMVANGLISRQGGEAKKLKLANRVELETIQGTRSVNIGGQEYSGYDGLLAAERARSAEDGTEVATPMSEFTYDDGLVPEGEAYGDGGFSLPGGDSYGGEATGLFPSDEKQDHPFVSYADEWKNGRREAALGKMSSAQFAQVQDALRPACLIRTDLNADGTERYTLERGADASVVAAVGAANAQREMNEAQAAQVVAHITLGAKADAPDVKEDDVYKILPNGVVQKALGRGNAGEGEFRARAIIRRFLQSGGVATGRVRTEQMQNLIDAHLKGMPALADTEAGRMKALNPMKKLSDNKYKKPDADSDPVGHRDWHFMFNVYKRYRDDFNPKHAEGDATKEEFEEIAPFFYSWYMGNGASPYNKQKARTGEIIKDYLMGQIALELTRNVQGVDPSSGALVFRKKDDGTGYNDELEVVKAVIGRELPEELGMQAVEQQDKELERERQRLATKWRQSAVPYFQRLLETESDKDRAKREAAEARAEAARQKQQAAQEKEEKKRRQQEFSMRRKAQHSALWRWDNVNNSNKQYVYPTCTLPKALYDALETQYGLDAQRHVPYVVINRQHVQVTGPNEEGCIMLNTAAVQIVNGRPRRGRKANTAGQTDFYLDFK